MKRVIRKSYVEGDTWCDLVSSRLIQKHAFLSEDNRARVAKMDDLIEKIKAYLEKNPDSTARVICRSIGVDKHYVNSCLYSNEDVHFVKEGMAPPLWRNCEKAPAVTRKDKPPILARMDKLDRQLESRINRRETREIREERVLGGDAWNSLDAVLGAEDESPQGPDTDLSVQDLIDDRD